MMCVWEPNNELLKLFVDSIYIFRESADELHFTAYPSANTPVAIMRNATVSAKETHICITGSNTLNVIALACNQFSNITQIRYLQLVDEIAINFKPLGFATFTRSKPNDNKIFSFHDWNEFLPDLLRVVFETKNQKQQLHHIEQFLLDQYVPLQHETAMLKALDLLNDTSAEYKIQDIADLVGLHYKQLYRQFIEYVGCNPIHYRKLKKFRSSIVSKLKSESKTRLIDICYTHNYTDQSLFIKQFAELSGKRPKDFFKEVTSFGDNKVILKID